MGAPVFADSFLSFAWSRSMEDLGTPARMAVPGRMLKTHASANLRNKWCGLYASE